MFKQPKILIPDTEIKKRVNELALEITKDYEGKTITVVGVLKGSVIFLVDLIRSINLPILIDFLEVSSYGNETTSSGIVKISKDLTHSITDQDVLIVEDIIDTGLTMNYLMENLKTRKPKSLKICALLEKTDNLKLKINIDYKGFTVPNKFLVGYGLDYQGYFRNLDYLGYIDE
jgi:hypoxanthine phosphoribosyltransferase